jgi:hypothetical protein
MFVRISFDDRIKVSRQELEEIRQFLCDEVEFAEIVVDKSGEQVEFLSWRHTFDEKEAEEKEKQLVKPTDMVILGTNREYLVDLNSFVNKFPHIKVKVRGILVNENSNHKLMNQLLEAQQKLENALKSFNEKIEFNEVCNVHIGNIGLLHINQVAYANDKCTEELQELLNEGWRIIAVCPQPDQRRPDYILGRYNPSGDKDKLDCISF